MGVSERAKVVGKPIPDSVLKDLNAKLDVLVKQPYKNPGKLMRNIDDCKFEEKLA